MRLAGSPERRLGLPGAPAACHLDRGPLVIEGSSGGAWGRDPVDGPERPPADPLRRRCLPSAESLPVLYYAWCVLWLRDVVLHLACPAVSCHPGSVEDASSALGSVCSFVQVATYLGWVHTWTAPASQASTRLTAVGSAVLSRVCPAGTRRWPPGTRGTAPGGLGLAHCSLLLSRGSCA